MYNLEKLEAMHDIEEAWRSAHDYILSSVFNKPISQDPETNKFFVNTQNIEGEIFFIRNQFPYQIDSDIGSHYVLWIGLPHHGAAPDEQTINIEITSALQFLTNDDSFEFAWYENPKMTVPSVYHVQVHYSRGQLSIISIQCNNAFINILKTVVYVDCVLLIFFFFVRFFGGNYQFIDNMNNY